MVNYMLYRGRW